MVKCRTGSSLYPNPCKIPELVTASVLKMAEKERMANVDDPRSSLYIMMFSGCAKIANPTLAGNPITKVINQACLILCSTAFISFFATCADIAGINAKVREEEKVE